MFGTHVHKNRLSMAAAAVAEIQSIVDASTRGVRVCVQLFVCGPRNYTPTLTPFDIATLTSITGRAPDAAGAAQIIIHGAYVDNPWSGNEAGIVNIRTELATCREIGALGVIVHLAAGANNAATLERVFAAISDIGHDIRENTILYLEINAAKASHNTFETPHKLEALFNKISTCTTRGLKIGLCIDTAHLFACGVALATAADAKLWFEDLIARLAQFEAVFGYQTPIMIHLNDSATPCGSGRDEHAVVGRGNLWKARNDDIPLDGYKWIIATAKLANWPVIIERGPKEAQHDLLLLGALF